MWQVSVVCLGITMALCIAGTFSCKYNDNLMQRVGMFALFIGCWPSLRDVWDFEYVSRGAVVAHIGLAAFALGTALKVWKFRPRKHKIPWLHIRG